MNRFALAVLVLLCAGSAQAEPTRVMVRAQALDAKFIGDHMGGVKVTLTDARTGAVLARGLTKGGTGDTRRIMVAPRPRGAPFADTESAGFEATLDLKQPTLVRADAEGPIGKPGATIHVSSTPWILPGRDVLGDGWVLSFPGLVIEPTTAVTGEGVLRVDAKVSLMCGCPIEPGGLWDAANYHVEATLLRGDKEVASTPLAYSGQPSQFSGLLPAAPAGHYRLRVTAADAKTPNTGVSDGPITIRKTVAQQLPRRP